MQNDTLHGKIKNIVETGRSCDGAAQITRVLFGLEYMWEGLDLKPRKDILSSVGTQLPEAAVRIGRIFIN